MSYQINEGELDVVFANDRSMNVMQIQNRAGTHQYQQVISRDTLPQGETLRAYVERQLRTLERQVKRLVRHQQKEILVGSRNWPGILIHTQFTQAGQDSHQIQIAAQLDEQRVLVFTLSDLRPFPESIANGWIQAICAFQAR